MNGHRFFPGQGLLGWRPEGLINPYTLCSLAGVGGYLGALIVALNLEETLADLVRTCSVVFFLVMGVVREFFRPSAKSVRERFAARPGVFHGRAHAGGARR